MSRWAQHDHVVAVFDEMATGQLLHELAVNRGLVGQVAKSQVPSGFSGLQGRSSQFASGRTQDFDPQRWTMRFQVSQ